MAQFLMARFLSQALEWKDRFPAARFYAGLRFVPFIYEKARFIFSNYSRSYPDNKVFTQKFVKDLRDGNKELLKIINPEAVTWEHTAVNKQFEEEAGQEQQNVARATGQPPARSFSLITPPPPETSQAEQDAPEAETSQAPPQAEPPPVSQSSFQVPGLPASFTSTAKTLGPNIRIFVNKYLGRIGSGLANIAKGVGRGIAGGVSSGLGAAAPALREIGPRLVNGLQRISAPGGIGGSGGIGKLSKSSNRFALVFIGVLLFMVLVGGVIGGLPGTTPTGEASPITGSSGDLSTCLFTRSDQSPVSASFQSPILLGYFQEVSAKSGVPAAVLAGIARIESPGIVNQTDTALPSFACATSDTGAKGLMQVQPPGTTGYSAAGVALGAQYLGIPVDQLDFCDLRQNIFLGAGVISAKAGGSWDAAKTNDKSYIDNVAEGYYGCLNYGAPPGSPCSDARNIYSYGGDLYASVSQCKAAAPSGLAGFCPAQGTISTPYGYNIPDYPDVGNEGCGSLPRCHNGVDIAAALGSPVKAPVSGNITNGFEQYKGNYVKIDDPTSSLTVTLEHLDTIIPTQNAAVAKGAIVGTVGRTGEGVTGPVLHYKVEKGGALINPLLVLGDSAAPDPNTLKSASDIDKNDYAGVTPATGNWGECK